MILRLFVFAAVALASLLQPVARAHASDLPQIMVVGVVHLEARADLHNAVWGSSVFAPGMQQQIARLVGSLAKFRPNKVMIEGRADDPTYVQRYAAYRRGAYRLGPNEDDQFGYRLAGMLGLPTIYPIDSTGRFPFDYDRLQAAAAKHGQNSILTRANAELAPLVRRSNQLEQASNLIGVMRYINSPEALKMNAGWYLYLDLIGSESTDTPGESLTSNWYARNLQIFANIARNLNPGDRVVVFIGQGHAAMLRPMIERSSFLKDVDPAHYLQVQ